jgi:hypothetical protein
VQSGFSFSTGMPDLHTTPSGDLVLARHPIKVIIAKAIEIINPNLFISKTFRAYQHSF